MQHDVRAAEDYRLLKTLGIQTIREASRWPLIDLATGYDWSAADLFIDACAQEEMEPIWDLFHYGYPEDLDPFSEIFGDRLAAYAFEFARRVSSRLPGPHYFTPVNEPSYFAWAAGHAAHFKPYAVNQAYELKVSLCCAAIKAANAIWEACPSAEMVTVDPICRVVPPVERPDLQDQAVNFNTNVVYESLDMISGRLRTELGGSRRHLGLIGVNYYWTCQWEIGETDIQLADDDPRRVPLSSLIKNVQQRYGGDVFISETSHYGDMRPVWFAELARDIRGMLNDGVPLKGVCIYPILGMMDWHESEKFHCMGMWDLLSDGTRVCCDDVHEAFKRMQQVVKSPVKRFSLR
ncbi:MAG TPA: family 1 glycosylhydrolase [Fimbriimonadaceae bacterium]|jgi:beta-glucosidase/6-phospho-beta-glucosidase/beta-galactosidase